MTYKVYLKRFLRITGLFSINRKMKPTELKISITENVGISVLEFGHKNLNLPQ